MDLTRGEVLARLRGAGCVWAEDEADLLLAEFSGPALVDAVRRRTGGHPLELVLGWASFCGLRIAVRPGVFIPRARAEPLARAALAEVASRAAGAVVLDLGCGSGALAAAVAVGSGTRTQVWASDVSDVAVSCARDNGATYGFRVGHGDWFDGVPVSLLGGLDVVLAYLPHVPDSRLADIPGDYSAVEDERTVAGGPDGLDPLRTVLAGLDRWLAPSGVLLTMVAGEQLDATRGLVSDTGWSSAPADTADTADTAPPGDQESPLLSVRRATGEPGS